MSNLSKVTQGSLSPKPALLFPMLSLPLEHIFEIISDASFSELISMQYCCLTRPSLGVKNLLSSSACGDSGPAIVCVCGGGVCAHTHMHAAVVKA